MSNSGGPFNPPARGPARTIVEVAGIPVEAIISTGSEACIIPKDVLRPEVRLLPSAKSQVMGPMAQMYTALGRVVLEVRLGPLQAETPFVVVEKSPHDVILGMDFIEEHGIGVYLAGRRLVLSQHGGCILPLLT